MTTTRLSIRSNAFYSPFTLAIPTGRLDENYVPVFRDPTDAEIVESVWSHFNAYLEQIESRITYPITFLSKHVSWNRRPDGKVDWICSSELEVQGDLDDEEIQCWDTDTMFSIRRPI